MISNIKYVKEVMGQLKAKKKFGQNFIVDSNTVDKIGKIACDKELKTIEIGPGLGALTEMLLKYSESVDAYEIDRDMYDRLISNIDDERLNVYLEDFLDTDLSKYNKKVNVCGNLPYYVTTPILFGYFGISFLWASSNNPSLSSFFFSCSKAICNSPSPSSVMLLAYN